MGHPQIWFGSDARMLPPGTILTKAGLPILADLSLASWIMEDFRGGATTGQNGWSPIAANSGTAAITVGLATNPGLLRLSSATSNNAQAAIRHGVSNVLLGGGAMWFEWKFILSALSTALEEYSFRVGLLDSTTGEAVDGLYACYDRATDGDFFSTKAASNSSITKAVLASVPSTAATGQSIGFLVNAAGTSAQAYINRVAIGSAITVNIPVGAGRQTSPCAALIKSVGTTAVNVDVDFYSDFIWLTTAR